MNEPISIVLASEAPKHYSTTLRGTRPLDVLKKKGLVNYAVHNFVPGDDNLYANLENCDLIFAVNNANEAWNALYAAARDVGKTVILDLDDNLWDVHPFNMAFETMGTYEAKCNEVDTGRVIELWTHGSEGFNLNKNRRNIHAIEETVNLANAMTTTTERLATVLAVHNPRTLVLPNTVDLSIWNPYRMPKPGFRIGWQGSQSHVPDMIHAAPQIAEFVRRHEDVTLFVAGAHLKSLIDAIPPEQIELQKWAPTEAYPFMLQCAALDVGLAPLVDNRFNRTKSSIKWMEYGAMQVPTIASNYPPYSDSIHDKADGWLVEDGEWLDTLERLYADRQEIKRVGWNVRERVTAEFDIEKRAIEWYEAFRMIMNECGGKRKPPRYCLSLGGRRSK